MFLGIDTTSQKVLICLGDGQGVLSFGEWPNDQTLSVKLQPEIEKLLDKADTKPKVIISVTGPGSFTSIRVGVATANALGYAWNTPVIPISRFEIYEEAQQKENPKIVQLNNIKDLVYAKICRDQESEYFVGTEVELKEKYADLPIISEEEVIEGPSRAELIFKIGERFFEKEGQSKFELPVTPLYVSQPNITKPKK